MKKSLLVTFDFPPITGGISHSLWNFCNLFPTNSTIVLTQKSATGINANFSIVRRKLLAPRFIWPRWLPILWHLWKICKQEGIEVIQVGQILPIGTATYILKKLLHIPYVVYVYGQDLVISRHHARKHSLVKKILREAQGIIANSEFTRKLAIEFGAHADLTIVAYPYFPRISGASVEQQALDSFKKAQHFDNAFTLLTVGNLVRRKGHEQVLRAVSLLATDYPQLRYAIVGDGPEMSYLKQLTNELKLGGSVNFYGRVPDNELALYFSSADLFIMPSRALKNPQGAICDVEGFGMVYLEAASFGKPSIGGDTGGIPEAVDNGKTGLLVNPESVEDIAAAIVRLMQDPVLTKTMGRAALQYVTDSYSPYRQAQSIIDLLK